MSYYPPVQRIVTHLFFFFIISSGLLAQPPAGYYDAATGSGAVLKTNLYNIINGHTVLSYDYLWTAFQTTDQRADGKVWDMYSNCNFTFVTDQCGNYADECDCYNREHSWPKSWFNDAAPMNSDMFHLVPTDGKVNGMRGNFPYGEVNNPTYTSGNGSKLGPCSYSGYNGVVFEPIDEYKGDFARNYFYMATRYENVIASWHSNDANAEAVLQDNSFPVFEEWFLTMLGEWHVADPVSPKEIERNNDIYTSFQHNRNPFIDHPGYVYQIWGVGTPEVLPEPSAYPLNFSAHNIHLQWSDATGSVLPDGYLIRMSTTGFDAIGDPADGTEYPDDPDDLNVAYGIQNAWFTNLSANTTYFFKLFSYNGSGALRMYKTDGSVPQLQQTTSP